ncbi:MAG: ABC transporter permease subunit, partial [Anaerolineales bacterium]|nr:ABC transporter permease subunit [Anaerolineales bacterium]
MTMAKRIYNLPTSRLLLWIPAILFLLSFFFYPLAKILTLTFNLETFTDPNNVRITYHALLFTFYQATLSTLLTFALGLPAAILFSKFDFRGKSLLRALTAVPFMMPTVVVASAFINVQRLTFDVSPFILILTAHVFYNTSIVIRIVGNAISRLDPQLEGAARSLGADTFHVWKDVLFPILRPSLLAAALLVFMFDFTSFGVILLLGGSQFATLEVEIYIRALQLPNLNLAALLATIQLIFTLIFSVLYSRAINQVQTQTAPRFSIARPPKTIRERAFVFTVYCSLFTFFLLPLLSLPIRSLTRLEADRGQRGEVQYGFTTDYYEELFINRRGSLFYVPPVQAAVNSLGFAGIT